MSITTETNLPCAVLKQVCEINSCIAAPILETMQEIAWLHNIFIDDNVWYNTRFKVCCATFVNLIPNSVMSKAICRQFDWT